MTTAFFIRVIAIIRAIPAGSVCSYGLIAEAAGNARASRQVSRILHSSTKAYNLPWHRIVAKNGCIAMKGEGFQEQYTLLSAEGIEVSDNGCIPHRFFWNPNTCHFDIKSELDTIGI